MSSTRPSTLRTDSAASSMSGPPTKGGAFERLLGRRIPPLRLDSTLGPVELSALAERRLVLFVYPHATGLPEPPVPEWDSIPGARGCTAQSCGFRDQHALLTELDVELAGLSVQSVDQQREFAARVGLRYRLISDPPRALEASLGLPTFTVGGRSFYRRLTVVAEEGLIVKLFDPIDAPAENAAEVVRWLKSRNIQNDWSEGGQ
jgi:peroxiredoxin